MFQNNGVLKKVSSKGWCKKSIYKTFVNILYSLLKIILIIVEVPGGGGGGYHDIFCVYRLGLFSFHFLFFFVGWGQNLNVNILGEFSVKIGFSFLVREIFGDVLGVS